MEERVQKFLSGAGLASRRKAEEFIKSKQVTINGRIAKLGDKVDGQKDVVKVYGKVVRPASKKIYVALYKPRGYVVSKRDPRGRKTVFSLLPEELRGKVWNVGRLDYDSDGLLILTNDGDLTQQLAHPKYEHDKEYRVTTGAAPTDAQLEQLREGVEIASGLTAPAKAKLRSNTIYLTIHEGKKRQIRRMFDAVGLDVQGLTRTRVNKFTLPAELKPGEYQLIKRGDIL